MPCSTISRAAGFAPAGEDSTGAVVDLRERGYADARVAPYGAISAEDIKRWTDAIGTEK